MGPEPRRGHLDQLSCALHMRFLCSIYSIICIGFMLFLTFSKFSFLSKKCKAYIPLGRKTICVGSSRRLRPPMPQFRIGDTNILVSKNAKICGTPNANPQSEQVEYRWCWVPNAKFLFVSLSLALGSQREHNFQWNMGFKLIFYQNANPFALGLCIGYQHVGI